MGLYPGSVIELPNSSPVAIAIVDTNGDQLPGVGGIPVTFVSNAPATAALTSVASSVVSVVALAANANRKQYFMYNATNKPVNLAYAATASATSFTIIIPAGGNYQSDLDGYTGEISAIWPSAPSAGPSLHVTEVTP